MTAIAVLWAAVAALCGVVALRATNVAALAAATWVGGNALLVLVSMTVGGPTGGLALTGAPARALAKTPTGTRPAVGRAVLAPWRWVSRALATVVGRWTPPRAACGPLWSTVPGTLIAVGPLQTVPQWFAAGGAGTHTVLDLTAEWEWVQEWQWSVTGFAAADAAKPAVYCLPLLDDCMCSPAHLVAALRAALGTEVLSRRRIYVGCMFGVGRSAAVGALLAAALHGDKYRTVDAALAALRTVRPQAAPTAPQLRTARGALELLRAP
jgi:protein-tyrosine phosphatase